MKPLDQIQWCIDAHRATNHFYDKYLPYEFHLRLVETVFEEFKHLLKDEKREIVKLACFGHDLIEDARVSYNDCKLTLGEEVADIIYAVTNLRGKTRAERAGWEYYRGINTIKEAVFVKLCDRIANVRYSILTKSRQFEMYKKENQHFCDNLFGFVEMKEHLNSLFDAKR